MSNTKLNSVKKGTILSETSFFKVDEVTQQEIIVTDENGNKLKIGSRYVENVLVSADYFDKEEKKTMSELADLFINSPRIAMTVAFYKKDVAKTKKAYNAEIEAAIAEVSNAKISEAEAIMKRHLTNPISPVIKGELRVMKGRHYGFVDDLGRVHFIDMELEKDPKRTDDSRSRQVDPRTIEYVIVSGVKYNLKK